MEAVPPTTSKRPDTKNSQHQKQQLRALGFCGADDSVDPRMLGMIARAYPVVEFGVLFRPDLQGTPRYASPQWIERLSNVASRTPETIKLAAHLCGSRVNEVLRGEQAFISSLEQLGFTRVQINATAVNGVDTSRLGEDDSARCLLRLARDHPRLEFIFQKNSETDPLWTGLLRESNGGLLLPRNVSVLVDESKGTGTVASSWPSPPPDGYDMGYAGGIGPNNIRQVLTGVLAAAQGHQFWIDMESGLRSIKNDRDVFDLDKCYEVISAVCDAGLMSHPDYLAI